MENVVLVDERDSYIGAMEKMQAHVEGKLHRAVSVFIFNSQNELLLQQRASVKYHSPLKWTNTCCGHPRPGEEPLAAATRRLYEEMGIECTLVPAFSFIYKADVGQGLVEHEFDHVFTGVFDGIPKADRSEVAAWMHVSQQELTRRTKAYPDVFTPWFLLCVEHNIETLFDRG